MFSDVPSAAKRRFLFPYQIKTVGAAPLVVGSGNVFVSHAKLTEIAKKHKKAPEAYVRGMKYRYPCNFRNSVPFQKKISCLPFLWILRSCCQWTPRTRVGCYEGLHWELDREEGNHQHRHAGFFASLEGFVLWSFLTHIPKSNSVFWFFQIWFSIFGPDWSRLKMIDSPFDQMKFSIFGPDWSRLKMVDSPVDQMKFSIFGPDWSRLKMVDSPVDQMKFSIFGPDWSRLKMIDSPFDQMKFSVFIFYSYSVDFFVDFFNAKQFPDLKQTRISWIASQMVDRWRNYWPPLRRGRKRADRTRWGLNAIVFGRGYFYQKKSFYFFCHKMPPNFRYETKTFSGLSCFERFNFLLLFDSSFNLKNLFAMKQPFCYENPRHVLCIYSSWGVRHKQSHFSLIFFGSYVQVVSDSVLPQLLLGWAWGVRQGLNFASWPRADDWLLLLGGGLLQLSSLKGRAGSHCVVNWLIIKMIHFFRTRAASRLKLIIIIPGDSLIEAELAAHYWMEQFLLAKY